MWPFTSRRKVGRADKAVKRLITGLVIGGAIGSVVGKHLVDKHENEIEETDDENSVD